MNDHAKFYRAVGRTEISRYRAKPEPTWLSVVVIGSLAFLFGIVVGIWAGAPW